MRQHGQIFREGIAAGLAVAPPPWLQTLCYSIRGSQCDRVDSNSKSSPKVANEERLSATSSSLSIVDCPTLARLSDLQPNKRASCDLGALKSRSSCGPNRFASRILQVLNDLITKLRNYDSMRNIRSCPRYESRDNKEYVTCYALCVKLQYQDVIA